MPMLRRRKRLLGRKRHRLLGIKRKRGKAAKILKKVEKEGKRRRR